MPHPGVPATTSRQHQAIEGARWATGDIDIVDGTAVGFLGRLERRDLRVEHHNDGATTDRPNRSGDD